MLRAYADRIGSSDQVDATDEDYQPPTLIPDDDDREDADSLDNDEGDEDEDTELDLRNVFAPGEVSER